MQYTDKAEIEAEPKWENPFRCGGHSNLFIEAAVLFVGLMTIGHFISFPILHPHHHAFEILTTIILIPFGYLWTYAFLARARNYILDKTGNEATHDAIWRERFDREAAKFRYKDKIKTVKKEFKKDLNKYGLEL